MGAGLELLLYALAVVIAIVVLVGVISWCLFRKQPKSLSLHATKWVSLEAQWEDDHHEHGQEGRGTPAA